MEEKLEEEVNMMKGRALGMWDLESGTIMSLMAGRVIQELSQSRIAWAPEDHWLKPCASAHQTLENHLHVIGPGGAAEGEPFWQPVDLN